ncbi:DUF4870 domain-containing protein [Nocardioides oleivorans]|uniref:DUF4870 domain-containing protein n=1 Tax=Nocardioides oleivorans TaxID=273676 RepID=A0A4Q2RTE2_9ACTN|nr:DUF4870 domain-containing protein [Nocardioides oleivorans]RYB91105.1 DUF4870 domain-containing protein [Nocardioides oleivorans]
MSDQYPTGQQDDPTRAYSQQAYGQPGQQAYGQPQPAYQQAPLRPDEERTWGMLSHLGALVAMIASVGFLGFVASIVVFVLYKDRGPFVRAHAANSINVQISMFIWWLVLGVVYVVLGVVTLGIGFFVLLPVFFVPPVIAGVMHVIGAVKAHNGEWWNPPFTPQFVK